MAEKLIKTITVGEDIGKVDYTALANLPKFATDALMIKLIKAVGQEDAFASILYPDYPVITFTAEEGITIKSINKGNAVDAATFPASILASGKVIAYNKSGTGYDKGDELDTEGNSDSSAQFNAFIIPVEGMSAYAETVYTGETQPYNNIDFVDVLVGDEAYVQVKATKVTDSFTLNIKSCPKYTIEVENYTGKDLVYPESFSSKAGRCEFEIKVTDTTNPLTAATCGDVDIMDAITGAQNSKKTKWSYTLTPTHESITGNIKLVFGTKPAEDAPAAE